MTVSDYIKSASERLAAANVHCADPVQHTEQIIQSALSVDKSWLVSWGRDELDDSQVGKIESVLSRRLQGEPLQYITGYQWFWESKFEVGPGVLIPRKETEHTVEYLLSLDNTRDFKIAELGPGSGNIGISLLLERPHWEWFAFEKNLQTIPYLNKNTASLLPSGHHFHLQAGDFFEKAPQQAPYDIVVSNPPYISVAEYNTLAPELKAEPDLALIGGETGIEILAELLKVSKELLTPEGFLVSEIASDQGKAAVELSLRHGFRSANVLKDYAGLDRVLIARKG